MVRKATINDLPQLAVLFDAYRVFYEKQSDIVGAAHFLQARIQNEESLLFVHEIGQVLTGFVQLYPLFSSTNMRRLWLLNDLYVAPKFRGQQISIALIDQAKQVVIQTKAFALSLETAKTNTIGNFLYPRTDFVLDTTHNFYTWTP